MSGGYAPVCDTCGRPIFGRHDRADCAAQVVMNEMEDALVVARDYLAEAGYDSATDVVQQIDDALRALDSHERAKQRATV